MSYLTQSRLAADPDIIQRVTACAAAESIKDPGYWVQQRTWVLSTQPGWVDAYKAAGTKPGANEAAITDAMILDAVRALNAPPPTPTDSLMSPAE